MKRLSIILLGLLVITQNVLGQEFTPKKKLNIKWMPLSLIAETQRFRIGVEFVSENNLAYNLDVGLGSDYFGLNFSDVDNHNYRFFEVRPEIKYIYAYKKRLYFYSALELFYLQAKTVFEDGKYEDKETEKGFFFGQADFSKQKYGFHIKGGFGLTVKALCLDWYVGFGFARRIIDYTNVVNRREGASVSWKEIPKPYLFEQDRITPHVTVGFKIGYDLIK